MNNKDIWIAVTKSRPLPGCNIDMDGCEFYFADAYVALSEEARPTAIASVTEQVKEALAGIQLELAEVSLCARFAPEEWLDKTDSIEPMHELANKARGSEYVVFSGFRSEEVQALFCYHYTVEESDEK